MATTGDASTLAQWRPGPEWLARELLAPCFRANFVNATGAGDCTIAGLISSIASGGTPEETLATAVATGACSTEAADASSGVIRVAELQARIARGWDRMEIAPTDKAWHRDKELNVCIV